MNYGLSVHKRKYSLATCLFLLVSCLLLVLAPLLVSQNVSASTIDSILVTSGPTSGGTLTPFSGNILPSETELEFDHVIASNAHSMGLTKNGEIYSWGDNSYGQLGNNTDIGSVAPIKVDTTGALNGKEIVQVALGDFHSLALSSDGQLYSWGANWYGQVGDGTYTDRWEPVAIGGTGLLSGKTITKMSSYLNHSVVLTSDGELFAWGENYSGALGNGTTIDSPQPVAVDMTGALNEVNIVDVSAGVDHTLALSDDGRVYAWGSGNWGQLGNGAGTSSSVPVAVDITGVLNGKTVTKISAGHSYSVALTSEGEVFTWGDNGSGELGNGTSSNLLLPDAIDTSGILSGKSVADISAGTGHVLAITTDDILVAWGYNSDGQVGNGSNQDSLSPTLVNTDGVLSGLMITQFDAGRYQSLAVSSEGKVYGWGRNEGGVLGQAYPTRHLSPITVVTPPDLASLSFSQVSAGSNHNIALASDNQLYAWGNNEYGQLGTGTNNHYNGIVQVDTSGVLSGKTITQVWTGYNHSFAKTSDGQLYAWGLNLNGQLGDGTSVNRSSPVAVNMSGVLSGINIIQTSGGEQHTLALGDDGKVYAWGSNTNGRLGTGNTTASTSPVAVSTAGALNGKTIVDISAGTNFSLAISSDGLAYGWGNNSFGRLGTGNTTASTSPVAVSTAGALNGKTIVDISAGYSFGVALDSNGQAYGWGYNVSGQLGNGTNTNSNSPVAVDTSGILNGVNLISIQASSSTSYHTVAVGDDNQIYTWGINSNGQLGNGTSTSSSLPTAVDLTGSLGANNISMVSTGGSHSIVISDDGQLYGWGHARLGQLSDGLISQTNVPIATNLPATSELVVPTVTFGGLPAVDVELIDDGSGTLSLQSTTPPHPAGPVDVVISFEGQSPIILAGAYTYLADEGTPPVDPENPGDTGTPVDPPVDNDASSGDSERPADETTGDTQELASSGVSVWPVVALLSTMIGLGLLRIASTARLHVK